MMILSYALSHHQQKFGVLLGAFHFGIVVNKEYSLCKDYLLFDYPDFDQFVTNFVYHALEISFMELF